MRISKTVVYCRRCQTWFDEDEIVECIDVNGKHLADLCNECVDAWEKFESFMEGNA